MPLNWIPACVGSVKGSDLKPSQVESVAKESVYVFDLGPLHNNTFVPAGSSGSDALPGERWAGTRWIGSDSHNDYQCRNLIGLIWSYWGLRRLLAGDY